MKISNLNRVVVAANSSAANIEAKNSSVNLATSKDQFVKNISFKGENIDSTPEKPANKENKFWAGIKGFVSSIYEIMLEGKKQMHDHEDPLGTYFKLTDEYKGND